MSERVYGSEANVRAELEGNTEFDKDIEDQLISRVAEIERNNGVVPALVKADWIVMWVILVSAVIGCVYCFATV